MKVRIHTYQCYHLLRWLPLPPASPTLMHRSLPPASPAPMHRSLPPTSPIPHALAPFSRSWTATSHTHHSFP